VFLRVTLITQTVANALNISMSLVHIAEIKSGSVLIVTVIMAPSIAYVHASLCLVIDVVLCCVVLHQLRTCARLFVRLSMLCCVVLCCDVAACRVPRSFSLMRTVGPGFCSSHDPIHLADPRPLLPRDCRTKPPIRRPHW
jgi:hypothetical protein